MHADKQILRKQILTARASEPKSIRNTRNIEIAHRLFALPQFQCAKTIFCYCSTSDEINTDQILQKVLEDKKILCVPRCEQPGIMSARRIQHLTDFVEGKYGIQEPNNNQPLVTAEEIDLCIIPCLCADQRGFRLGYGGGYYDRFLAHCSAYMITLCADCRLLDEIPHENTDIPSHCILTERQVCYP